MRLVFVNHAHPGVQHVAGMRLASFAGQLAMRGHRVILVTATTLGNDAGCPPPERASEEIAAMKPGSFLHIACAPVSRLAIEPLNSIVPLRRAATLARMLFADGTFGDWVRGSEPYWPALSAFRPQAVVGTFGNVTNLALAQRLARMARAPWIADVKDNWDAFIPAGLRRYMAWRFRDVSAVTANSRLHADLVAPYMALKPQVIYSGIPEQLSATSAAACDHFRIAMVGSVRSEPALRTVLVAAETWRAALPEQDAARIEFFYAGADMEIFNRVAAATWRGPLNVRGWLPLAEMARECKAAGINCYMWAPWTFHHKLVELIALSRPIMSFPGEHEESIAIARSLGARLIPCATDADVRNALERAWADRASPVAGGDFTTLTWREAAIKLELVLGRALKDDVRA